ncbi:MAG: CrcB family protein [Bdellovibrionaceae bacterium]|nr:CrcB family protein [Bdellovibrionales bacterium]MCB9085576.1 CrcB family protein [Pseudobdellovibrionaceae bacterium]
MIYLGVGVFGAVGALIRFFVGRWVGEASFPYATLVVNVAGGFAIGYLFMVFQDGAQWGAWPMWVRTGVTVGGLGALTTFSTFSLESMRLMTSGAVGLGLLNILANNLLSLSCCYLGWKMGAA